jgi:hypothetical protein
VLAACGPTGDTRRDTNPPRNQSSTSTTTGTTTPTDHSAVAAEDRGDDKHPEEASTMQIELTVEGSTVRATLLDNATSRDFVSLLPLTLTLSDYAGTEKVADLPHALSTADAPAGIDPDTGDITYYAPWGNLAIFYRDFRYSAGLVKLGHIESGIEVLAGHHGDFSVTIERVQH